MDGSCLSLPAGPDKSSNESSPLLRKDHPPRPYQAYCATEASSRPTSPDALTPRPLQFGTSLPPICDEPRYLPRTSLTTSTPSGIEQSRSNGFIVSGFEDESDGTKEQPNGGPQFRSTMLVNSNHITQAVTPRGSHPLTGNQPITYDRTPSQFRMQRATSEYVATILACPRKPLPQHAMDTSIDHRPLPPLPFEVAPLRSSYNTDLDEVREQAWRLAVRADPEELSEGPRSYSQEALQSSPEKEAAREQAVRRSHRYLDIKRLYESLTLRNNATISPAWSDLGGNVQLPSTSEPHQPRGLLSDMDDDRRAFRRTQPKDAKFKYQFGRRPSVGLDKPPLSPLHHSTSTPSLGPNGPISIGTQEAGIHSHVEHHSPSLSSRSHTGAQTGPRPPPWGSSDNLDLRRQTRNEAREREEARRYRRIVDSGSSIYKGSESTDSLCRNAMKREVEEYREQVLQLYPDMAFDGSAGKGGRSCYCVVM
ncbi:hypothetical protein DE146DRAFT_610260 [Phaeosphaeria sp. MPI-PUGE-AT-0046c]|nr:hypothetical protein DE146DRAFT_610260 [Phaeosphaeria sp. MPI-PUGE-AT-0046c]